MLTDSATGCVQEWCEEHENLLRDWAEKARAYSWLHNKSGQHFMRINAGLTIPLIILSTGTASANFTMVGNTSLNEHAGSIFPLLVGASGVVTAVLSAMISFLKTNELQAKHEDSHRNFNKLFRNICMQLSMPPKQRQRALDACRGFREEFDRLISEAPSIPANVVQSFQREFYHIKNKPDIAADFDTDITIFGREKRQQENLHQFQKIRHFYRWMASVRRDGRPSIEERREGFMDVQGSTEHPMSPRDISIYIPSHRNSTESGSQEHLVLALDETV